MSSPLRPRMVANGPIKARHARRQASSLPTATPTSTVTSVTSTPAPQITQPTKVIGLTTTFTPPASCRENRLTMLPPPAYLIWANEPVPAANQTVAECFPKAFLSEYRSVSSSVAGSSVVPAMGGLECPVGHCTALAGEGNYAVCCPSGYILHPPETTVDPKRPGYGGTCYSDFAYLSTYTVTAYNATGQTHTAEWIASVSGAQAYAHPIDGFAASVPTLGCHVSKNSTTTSFAPPASSAPAKPSMTQRRVTVAGATIGAVTALVFLITAVWLFLRWLRQRRRPPTPPPKIYHMHREMLRVEAPDTSVAKYPIFEKDTVVINEMGRCSVVGMKEGGERYAARGETPGPFEMSGDAVGVVGEGKGGGERYV